MRKAVALVLFAMAVWAGDAHGQGVGSWLNSPPGSKAIQYDARGRRIYWDANGFVVGHYDFRTGRYTSVIEARAAAATTTANNAASPRKRRDTNPQRLAIVYRGGGRSFGRATTSSSSRGPKVIISGNFPSSNIVRHERRPPPQPNFAQTPGEFATQRQMQPMPPLPGLWDEN